MIRIKRSIFYSTTSFSSCIASNFSSSFSSPFPFTASSRHFSTSQTAEEAKNNGKSSGTKFLPDDGLKLSDFVSSSESSSSPVSSPTFPPSIVRKPEWLKAPLPEGPGYRKLKNTVKSLGLSTVCEEARCPNIGECWNGGPADSSERSLATATLMLMGSTCTRACRFCSIKKSRAPGPIDPEEPDKVSSAIHAWGLDYVVLTAVNRDDLPDFGAAHMAETVKKLKNKRNSESSPVHYPLVEVLSPDFQGSDSCIRTLATSGLDVFAHNLETVEGLQRFIRDSRANYQQSLKVLEKAKLFQPGLLTKSSLMLGCGESREEILQALKDLRSAGVEIVTLGQYLRPGKGQMRVQEYIHPDQFNEWRDIADQMGFLYVASGPLVRSSYRAGEFFIKAIVKRKAEGALLKAAKENEETSERF